MKCPACDKILKQIESVCGEYTCINSGCLENKKARVQAYAEFYRLTQADMNANYHIENLPKNRKEK